MKVQLSEQDKIVLVYNPDGNLYGRQAGDDTAPQNEPYQLTAIAWDANNDTYVVVWRSVDQDIVYTPEGEWELGWRGDFEACLKWFGGLVEDLESDRYKGEPRPLTPEELTA
ncbi:MAG TPA: hypothetical protein VM715_12630 [Candidatus Acidoferrum sp.]|nr:hypothetical protein [Candidatus Acidoferrum sp.]